MNDFGNDKNKKLRKLADKLSVLQKGNNPLIRVMVFLLLILACATTSLAHNKQGLDITQKIKINLSKEEKAWIKKHPDIRLGVDPVWQPIEYVNKNGKYQGISSDYVRILNRRLGLNMKIVPNLTWPQVMDLVPKKSIDVLPGVTKTSKRMKYFNYSEPYFYVEWVVISRADSPMFNDLADLVGRIVSVNEGYASHHRIQKQYPAIPLRLEKTTLDALQSVAEGRSKATVVELNIATLLIHGYRIHSLKIDKHIFQNDDPLAFAVRNDWPELVQILNKGLASISPDERKIIKQKWLTVPISIGFSKIDVLRIIFYVIVVMGILIVFFLFWNRRLKKEIKERKKAEENLRESESTIQNKLKAILEPEGDIGTLELSDIIDAATLQSIMEDLYRLTGVGAAILDLSGNILVAIGWQDICTKFHRCNPDTQKNCIESDTILTSDLSQGKIKAYRCKNNMWDIVTPLIVGDNHVGNIFIGQFFYEDKTPDVELFRKQARKYGFDEKKYLDALELVPRFSREKVDTCMQFYSKLSGMISTLSFSLIQQSRMITEGKLAEKELINEKTYSQKIISNMADGLLVHDFKGIITDVNPSLEKMIGYTKKEILGRKIYDFIKQNEKNKMIKMLEDTSSGSSGVVEHQIIHKNGQLINVYVSVSPLKDSTNKIYGAIAIITNITERIKFENEIKEANKELEKLAFTDSLTGLINRKPFIELLDKNISKHRRIKQKMALLFMDLDNFKSINDIYGHEIGDKVLKKASEIIRKHLRKGDFIGRFGGDEFIVCLDNIGSLARAVNAAQKINEAFCEKIKIGKLRIDTGASIGIALYPDDAWNVSELLKNSDLAMYKAKKQRKNSYNFFNSSLEEELMFDLALRNAFEKNEFKISYQIIVDRNETPYCAEALLRWENPVFGTVMPLDFIPALDRDRSIIEVGEWVFRESCRKLKAVNKSAKHQIHVSINISQFQMEDDLFVGRIENIIKDTGIDPKNILIEITEKNQIQKTEEVKNTLIKLKKIGIGFIALDDFGTGYSSFSNLLRYPIDIVKIDKFFIDRIESEKYSGITSALISLIKRYDLLVVAEGVETEKQFELLKDMGCDYFQGFYFYKPQKNISKLLNISRN